MAIVMRQAGSEGVPESPLPLFVRNTFIDVEDDTFEADPRRASSEPPSCRHGDQRCLLDICFKCNESSVDYSESTASGPGSPRGSISDETSEDGKESLQQVASPIMPTIEPTSELQLNPDAPVWSPAWRPMLFPVSASPAPLPLLAPALSILAMIPMCFRRDFKDLIQKAKNTMCGCDVITSVRSFEGPGLWGKGVTIVGSLSSEDMTKKDEVLKSIQDALLLSAEESESVYVMGYSLRPFMPTENGVAAMLGGMHDDGWACWDMLTKGFCPHGGTCRKQHPQCMVPIYIEIKEVQG